MIPVKQIDPEDLPLYAMQLLSPEEMAEITLHLQHSPEARRILAEIQGDLAILAHTAELHSPPALARQRLMKHVAREKKPVPIDRQPSGTYSVRDTAAPVAEVELPEVSASARILPWIGWAVAAGVSFAGFYFYDQNQKLETQVTAQKTQLAKITSDADLTRLIVNTIQDPTATRVTLSVPETKPAPQGRAAYDAEKGSLIFLASNMEPLEPYKTYELWLIPPGQRDPIPAGTFKPDSHGYASVILPSLPKGTPAQGFAVSIEDDGGSSSPSSSIVLQGKTT